MSPLYLFFAGRKKRSAFARDVLEHSDGLYRYALKLTRDEQEAEDLVQETLLKAYRNYAKTRTASNYRAWSYTILRNEFISRKRKQSPEVPLDSEVESGRFAINATDSAPFQEDWTQGVSDEILAALDQLGEVHRSVIVLCDVEGLTYEEISLVMQCPIGTVRSRVFHARKQLRQHLREFAQELGLEKIDEAV